jgi:hypothetical protein
MAAMFRGKSTNLFLGGLRKIGIVPAWHTNPKPRQKPVH